MPLELKDLATQKPLMVPEEGLTFGREGGDANIQLRDTGVSKRHARVFGENGAWFLEDLGSSNGTWLQKERIKDATELLPGDIFQMSQAKYEVVQVMAEGDAAEPTNMARDEDGDGAMDEEPLADENEPTPKPMAAAKEPVSKKQGGAVPKENSVSKGKPAALSQPPPSKKMQAGGKPLSEPESSKAGKKPEAMAGQGPTDPGASSDAPKKKGGALAFISGAGLLILPTVIGVSLTMVQKAMHHSSGSTSSAVDAQVAAAEAQAEAAQKQAEAQAEAAETQAEAAIDKADKQVAAAEAKAAEKGEKVAAAAPTPPPAEEKKGTPPPPTPTPPPGKPAEAAAPPVATGGGYGAWHAKWEAVEKRITDDPTVLNKDPAVLALYKKLEEEVNEGEAKFAKSKDPKRVRDHLRDAELYEKSEKTVLELHQKLFK